MNKKGNYSDIFVYMILSVFVGVVIMFTFFIVSSFNTAITTIPSINSTIGPSISQAWVNKLPSSFDFVIPIIYILFFGFSVWSASKIESSHKFTFFFIFFSLMLGLFSLYIENLWDSFKTSMLVISPSLFTNFIFTNFFLDYMRYFVLLYAVTIGIMLYTRIE